jgi:glycosyltransferase involved in cell wall biosynthesis
MAVVIPVFNDWECADDLLRRLGALAGSLPVMVVYLVDDGSTDLVALSPVKWTGVFEAVYIVHAAANVGHQRAIAIGLTQALLHDPCDLVLVLDADGEDDPDVIGELVSQSISHPESIVVAQRRRRREALSFRAFYVLYRAGFRALTGKRLDFGNFCLLPRQSAMRLVHMPETWNHFPAAIMRSRVPIVSVPADRGVRFQGKSRMNFVSLVNHGLAAISTFTDVVFARLLILVSLMSGLCVLAAAGVVAVRFGTTVAIPGWGTTALGLILLGLFQALTLLTVMTFTVLSARSNVASTPIHEAPKYISSVEHILLPRSETRGDSGAL